MITRGDTRIWPSPGKSILRHLEKPFPSLSQLYAKLRYLSYRFLHEATNTISCRSLCEATGLPNAVKIEGTLWRCSGIMIHADWDILL